MDYEFGWPHDSQKWQKMVNDAIGANKLKWEKEVDSQYILSGVCPRCEAQTGQYIDLEVLTADTAVAQDYSIAPSMSEVATDTGVPPDARRVVKISFSCLCEENPPHVKDTKGCGAGAGMGMDIIVVDPRG